MYRKGQDTQDRTTLGKWLKTSPTKYIFLVGDYVEFRVRDFHPTSSAIFLKRQILKVQEDNHVVVSIEGEPVAIPVWSITAVRPAPRWRKFKAERR